MSRTIHQPDISFAPKTLLGQIWRCICPQNGNDDPDCPALIEFNNRKTTEAFVLEISSIEDTRRGLGHDDATSQVMKPWPSVEAMTAVVSGLDAPFDKPRSAIDLAMDRADEMALTVPDHRDQVEVARGENPFVQTKEAVLAEAISSKYSLRRSALLHPERGRIVVARVEFQDRIGSIFMPEHTRKDHTDNNMEVVVLACGKPRLDPASGREVPMEYAPEQMLGRHAMIRRHAGLDFLWWDENGKEFVCYMIGQSEIWAWLDPPPGYEEEMQNSPELQKTLRYIASGLAQKQIEAGTPPDVTNE